MLKKTILKLTISALALLLVSISVSQAGGQTVRFAIIGDLTGGGQEDIYAQIVTEIERLQPDIILTVGDMIEGYTEDTAILNSEWIDYMELVKPLSAPIYYTPGNHDIFNDVMEEVYRKWIGKPYYSFDYGGIHFVILDNGRWEASEELPAEQLEWVNNDLQQNQTAANTFVFIHRPFWWNSVAEGKPDTLHTLFVKHGVDAVFTGHYHEYFSAEYDGITYTTIGSSGGATQLSPTGLMYHFAWVTVNQAGVHIAPIKMGSVLPWDEITVAERKIYRPVQFRGVSAVNAALVQPDLTVSDAVVTIRVDNRLTDFPIEDTLRWNIPDNWSVQPSSIPVAVGPGDTATFDFNVASVGPVYPTPQASINFTYAEGKNVTATGQLRVTRETSCYRATSAPIIDGVISEEIWQDPATRFFSPDGGDMTIDPVRFYFAFDADNLYLAAYCEETKVDSIRATVTEHDGAIYGEDCVGYFLQPDPDTAVAYQIYFNPLGTAFDLSITMNPEQGYPDYDYDWSGVYDVKTSRGDDHWSIEARIGLEQFGVTAETGRDWRLNFRRKQKRLDTAGDWQVPIDADPNSYGRLIFR